MKQAGTEVYAVILNTLEAQKGSLGKISDDQRILEAVHAYSEVFRTALPDELPLKCSVNYEIEIDANEKIPNGRLFKLSSEILRPTRVYIEEMFSSCLFD